MKKITKYTLAALAVPLFIVLAGMTGAGFLVGCMLALGLLAIYVLAGIVVLLAGKNPDLGKALLLAGGIGLLVGFSVCGLILANLKIGR